VELRDAGAGDGQFDEGAGGVRVTRKSHAVVIPLFGTLSTDFTDYLHALVDQSLLVVLVDNNPQCLPTRLKQLTGCELLVNSNHGGIAGGLNRGIEFALQASISWITLLDQDSRIPVEQIRRLLEPFEAYPERRLMVGPSIWDQQRQVRHGRWLPSSHAFQETRLLISSGTTFQAKDWPQLGSLHDQLHIDFVDHAWCFRAQARGFKLLQHSEVVLKQQFGAVHPNRFCRWLGMQLYSPERHFYGLRNFRWLLLQPYVPFDLKLKEFLKMLFKPWLWLLLEPKRRANLKAIVRGVLAPLPGRY
jgi:rhamnosyltransferase